MRKNVLFRKETDEKYREITDSNKGKYLTKLATPFVDLFMKQCFLLLMHFCCWGMLTGQPTGGELGGIVTWEDGAIGTGATVVLTHLPTTTKYTTACNSKGQFLFTGLHPGNGYRIEAHHLQGKGMLADLIGIGIGEVIQVEVKLRENSKRLKEVVVYSKMHTNKTDHGPLGFLASGEQVNRYASGSKHFHEMLRILPEVKAGTNGEGSISVAGQNYRYNALYTDGMVSHDVFGVAASGTYGGQAGVSPVSMEAIESIRLVTTPMDAMQGHFTGAAIHTTTKRGSNRPSQTGYYYFQGAKLAGRTIAEKEAGWHPDKFMVTTSGVSSQGAIVKNRLFYFFNAERQQRQIPYFIHHSEYPGDAIKKKILPIIRNHLITEYGYDPGLYDEAMEKMNGQKLLLRVDANIKSNQQIVFTARYLETFLIKPASGEVDEIHFSHHGYRNHSNSYHFSLEWKKTGQKNTAGQWLMQLTGSREERASIGNAFPAVKLLNGEGSVIFGTDVNSMTNRSQQNILLVRKQSQLLMGNILLSMGAEWMYGSLRQLFVPASLGYYIFREPGDFIRNRAPVFYQRNSWTGRLFPGDLSSESDRVRVMDAAAFVSARLRLSNHLTLWLGARTQQTWFADAVPENNYINEVIIPLFQLYRNYSILKTGQRPVFKWSASPKLAIEWKWHPQWSWQTAIAWQTGRLPLVWPTSLYANNGDRIKGFMGGGNQVSSIRLSPQWPVQSGTFFGMPVANQIPLFLITDRMSSPAQIRVHNRWVLKEKKRTFYAEWLITRQLQEPQFIQLNLMPTERYSSGAGSRKVYTAVSNASIPLPGGDIHPYQSSILLSTLENPRSGSMLLKLGGNLDFGDNAQLEWSYTNNNTRSLRDATGSVFSSVWQQTATVDGRNDPALSSSDFGINEKWVVGLHTGGKKKSRASSWMISLLWIGQSGERFSYVYAGKSIVRDNGSNGFNELMYVPTPEEIQQMVWVPFHNGIRPIGRDEQAEAMEQWIQTQPYLSKRRGQFAERNGGQLPFGWQCDVKLEREYSLEGLGMKGNVRFTLEIFNLAALLFRGAGRKWEMPSDRYPGIEILGFRDENSLVPLYQCDPDRIFREPVREGGQFRMGQLSRWLIQPGIKVSLF